MRLRYRFAYAVQAILTYGSDDTPQTVGLPPTSRRSLSGTCFVIVTSKCLVPPNQFVRDIRKKYVDKLETNKSYLHP